MSQQAKQILHKWVDSLPDTAIDNGKELAAIVCNPSLTIGEWEEIAKSYGLSHKQIQEFFSTFEF